MLEPGWVRLSSRILFIRTYGMKREGSGLEGLVVVTLEVIPEGCGLEIGMNVPHGNEERAV